MMKQLGQALVPRAHFLGVALAAGTLSAFAMADPFQESVAVEERFPVSTALAEGVSPERLEHLREVVQGFVDADAIVGGELLVLVNGKSILHEGFGKKDSETRTAMGTGNVFCVRSMTKPLIGTAILMLVEEKKLKLSDEVSEYLPALDVEDWDGITLEHLITHTAGLPFSLIAARDLNALGDIQKVAELSAGYELEFEAGSAFQYSDQGTDTLTAVVEVVSGMHAEEFVRTRILDPLGMVESACVMEEGHPLREKGLPKYAGGAGSWKRFWGPEDPPLFPFFLGSQGLYATLEDYAEFMEFWRLKGRGPNARLLKTRWMRKALEPTPLPFPGGSGFTGVTPGYGYLMQLWTRSGEEEGDDPELVAFGHSGSDGTHAWVLPKQGATVMYFTQSRNNVTGLRVEEALDSLFLGTPYNPNEAAPPLEQYLGFYQENEPDLYRAVVRDGEGMSLEIRGKGVVALSYTGEDRWKFRDNPSVVLEFDRSAEGEVTGYRIGEQQEYRFQPAADLPSIDEVVRRVAEAHRIDLLETVGPMRTKASIHIGKIDMSGFGTSLIAWPDRYRVDNMIGEEHERVAFDGKTIRYATARQEVTVMEGERAAALRANHFFARFGDLSRWHPKLQVIERHEPAGELIYLVRTGDTSGPASTIYVHWKTGRIVMVDSLIYADGMGRMGQRQEFSDYREIGGMTLPYKTETVLPNPVLGTITSTVDEIELGVEIPEGAFELAE